MPIIDNSTQLLTSNLNSSIVSSSTAITYVSSNIFANEVKNTSNYIQITSNNVVNYINTTNNNLSTNYYTKTNTDTLLNAKQANLTFTSPLTNSANTVSINLASYSTTGNDASYLLKTGGTMTGAIVNSSTTASDFKGIYIMHTSRQ